MKKITLFLLITIFFSVKLYSQDAEMKKWQEYMTPGKEHMDLAKMNGNWKYTSKMWMDPNGEPQPFDGTAKFDMLLGGRYQQMEVSGSIMGMDFKGIGICGFDNAKKIWLSTWIDNMGTGIMLMEGTYDASSKKLVFRGKGLDPMTGKDEEMIQTIKEIDDNTFEMEMFNVKDGKEFKSMEMRYVRM